VKINLIYVQTLLTVVLLISVL